MQQGRLEKAPLFFLCRSEDESERRRRQGLGLVLEFLTIGGRRHSPNGCIFADGMPWISNFCLSEPF